MFFQVMKKKFSLNHAEIRILCYLDIYSIEKKIRHLKANHVCQPVTEKQASKAFFNLLINYDLAFFKPLSIKHSVC